MNDSHQKAARLIIELFRLHVSLFKDESSDKTVNCWKCHSFRKGHDNAVFKVSHIHSKRDFAVES